MAQSKAFGRPSDGMGLDELREEFDWMFEFDSRMAERICGDADVHNLVDYVGKLERENAKLRELVEDMLNYIEIREAFGRPPTSERCEEFAQRADELGIEV